MKRLREIKPDPKPASQTRDGLIDGLKQLHLPPKLMPIGTADAPPARQVVSHNETPLPELVSDDGKVLCGKISRGLPRQSFQRRTPSPVSLPAVVPEDHLPVVSSHKIMQDLPRSTESVVSVTMRHALSETNQRPCALLDDDSEPQPSASSCNQEDNKTRPVLKRPSTPALRDARRQDLPPRLPRQGPIQPQLSKTQRSVLFAFHLDDDAEEVDCTHIFPI